MAYAANPTQAPARLVLRRERAFRSARRHSSRVRVFKFLFPFSALAISTLYIVPAVIAYTAPRLAVSAKGVTATVGSLIMIHPHYSGSHPQYGVYEINAKRAIQNITSTDVVTLDQITAEVISPSKEKTRLTAPDGVLRTKEELLTFEHGAVITGTNGLWARLRKAEMTFKTRIVTTREPVELRFHESSITADGAVIYAAESRVEFTGNVHVRLKREPAAAASASSEQPAPQLNWAAHASDEPAEGGAESSQRETFARP
jgi:lipopolysaccharide export system protein LptC